MSVTKNFRILNVVSGPCLKGRRNDDVSSPQLFLQTEVACDHELVLQKLAFYNSRLGQLSSATVLTANNNVTVLIHESLKLQRRRFTAHCLEKISREKLDV